MYPDEYADQLEHIGHGKSAAMTKVFNGIGSVAALEHRTEAEKAHAEARQLHDELARIEAQPQTAIAVSAP